MMTAPAVRRSAEDYIAQYGPAALSHLYLESRVAGARGDETSAADWEEIAVMAQRLLSLPAAGTF